MIEDVKFQGWFVLFVIILNLLKDGRNFTKTKEQNWFFQQEIREPRKETVSLNKKISALHKDNEALHKDNVALHKENADLHKENAHLNKENAALLAKIDTLEILNAVMLAKIEPLLCKIEALENQNAEENCKNREKH